ncbi:GNAT family N-acetyltransferase [Methylobrevis pamukkalensis]|uniref:Anhydro-N-acetylmuramic acid kinase n=1 Tax=Methylobrevis pamukkalensis TaxID=1439726 RepID=A0A1E3H326_9HYPH|nr:GNAT family N-acetyltransferase [Methylobrevis pamukkalensis]ODN70729.1 anhydro-N-acetylmuramic acid kinase [Methylobrevis pamukkalensis]
MTRIETDRLILRPWEARDLLPFAAMCDDPEVMEFFPDRLDLAGTEAVIARLEQRRRDGGFGMLAAEIRATGDFVGVIGLQRVPYDAAFTPAVEVGWRLARAHWGKGYASEGAGGCLAHGFSEGLTEIVAVAHVANVKSHAVMERIGMSRDLAADFDHPALPAGHRLGRHGLWRIARPAPHGPPERKRPGNARPQPVGLDISR